MTATQLFTALFNGGLVVCIIALIASLGMSITVKQVLAPIRLNWLLIGTVVLNIGLAPLIAIGVCHLLPLSSQAAVGVEIVTIAAAGPAGLKACQLVKRADMVMALSFVIVLQVLNILAAPLWARAIISGATVNVWDIIGDMLLLILLPLAVGLLVRARHAEHVDGWIPGLEKISNIALYIAIVAGIAVNWNAIVSALGSWVIVATILIYLIYFALGWGVGFRERSAALTIANVSAMRFTPIGLVVIATVLNNQSAYLTPAILFALFDTLVPFVGAAEVGRYLTRKNGSQPIPAAASGPAAATPSSTPTT